MGGHPPTGVPYGQFQVAQAGACADCRLTLWLPRTVPDTPRLSRSILLRNQIRGRKRGVSCALRATPHAGRALCEAASCGSHRPHPWGLRRRQDRAQRGADPAAWGTTHLDSAGPPTTSSAGRAGGSASQPGEGSASRSCAARGHRRAIRRRPTQASGRSPLPRPGRPS